MHSDVGLHSDVDLHSDVGLHRDVGMHGDVGLHSDRGLHSELMHTYNTESASKQGTSKFLGPSKELEVPWSKQGVQGTLTVSALLFFIHVYISDICLLLT